MNAQSPALSVDQYIQNAPSAQRSKLREIRAAIQKAAPKAVEKIAYGMPGYHLDGPLVYFAAAKNHLGFYPTPSGIRNFEAEFKKRGFAYSKGAVQFPLDEKLPVALVARIVRFRVAENAARAAAKQRGRKKP